MKRRRRGGGDGPQPFAVGLDAVLGHLGGPAARSVSGLFEGWAELVGDQVAAHATPRALRKGVLSVDVDDPAWANQLRYLEADLLGRFEQHLGAGVVTEIRWRVRPGRG